jgi:hypothetical protein
MQADLLIHRNGIMKWKKWKINVIDTMMGAGSFHVGSPYNLVSFD